MTLELIPPSDAADLAQLADVADRAREYAQAARAGSTLRAYRADWRAFARLRRGYWPSFSRRRSPW